ncbi:hypothetical protein [Actinomadura sp. RB99]|uniref:hypothetical protein n=1 Tax=Actinomadura sp. RB99 TaxID=2691577 RepID=UPI001683F369|nr:hypothetical protein [Actinomadura sp. RB99]
MGAIESRSDEDLPGGEPAVSIPGFAQDSREAQHRAMVAFDIVEFARNQDPDVLQQMREAMYRIVQHATAAVHLSRVECHQEDRGDGFFLLAPIGFGVHTLVDPLMSLVRTGLRKVNKTLHPDNQLRLRMAVHEGYVYRDQEGFVGKDLNHLFRLLNAPAFRASFESGELALIVSDDVYQDVVKWGPGLVEPAEFQQVVVTNKETRCLAWVNLPSQPAARSASGQVAGSSVGDAASDQPLQFGSEPHGNFSVLVLLAALRGSPHYQRARRCPVMVEFLPELRD